jgi:basic membrane protein A and related proteins
MRIRTAGLALLAGLSITVAACNSNAASTPPSSAATAAPSTDGSGAPSAAPSGSDAAPSGSAAHSDLVIGVVTDVGAVNDKSYNQYAYTGAQQGAAAIGADPPPVVVPNSSADYAPLIQAMVDQNFDIIVTTGVNLAPATAAAAKKNPNIWFIGVDQDPCINATGDVDPSSKDCSGDISKLLPRYVATDYAEDQAGYLAGIVAASATKSKVVGAIGGVSQCGPCVKYMQGFDLGAKSVDPAIKVKTAFVSDNDSKVGFSDQAAGKTFATQFINQNKGLDVLFQAAGVTGADTLTGKGILDAACAAGIDAIGVDVDQYMSYPAAQPCILTSAEKSYSTSVSASIVEIAAGSATGGLTRFDATNDGIGVSSFYDAASRLPADIQTRIDTATSGMKSGSLVTCPPAPACGKTPAPKIGD